MTRLPHVAAFSRLTTDHLPDVHRLDDRLQVFWTLSAAKADSNLEFLAATEIAEILRDVCGVSVARQRGVAILESAKKAGHVVSTRRNQKKLFKIMKRGEDELFGIGLAPIFVDPSKALTSIRTVEDILGNLEGPIRICDTYINNRTLDYVAQSRRAESIKLLTENVQDSGPLRRDLSAFSKEHGVQIEIRVATLGQLHDRYILHKDGMLWIGSSLKDMAKKQSMIIGLSHSFANEISKTFDRNWSNAAKFV